jgi:ribosomal protein S6--L-glutamate ligase
MRLAVLCSPTSWYFRDLTRAAGHRHELVAAPFTQIQAHVAESRSLVTSASIDLSTFDAVLVRTMPPGSLEQVVFRMDTLVRLEAGGKLVVNPPKAIEAAVDKYLTTARLAAGGLVTPPTIACQTWEDAMTAFAALGGDVVVKPLFGSEGRGITRINDEAIALRVFKSLAQIGAVIYVQQFISHAGHDLRVFVLGERMFAMRRRNGADWRTNVSRGATTEPVDVTPELADLARRASDAVGAWMAGVDLLPGRDGKLYVIEVNAVPGWKALARTHGVDIAQKVLDGIADRLSCAGQTGHKPLGRLIKE